ALIGIYTALAFIPVAAGSTTSVTIFVAALLVYTFAAAMNWPALESLISSGAGASAMSRRVGMYNLVWSGTNFVTFAASGWIISDWAGGLFALPSVVHAICALLMWWRRDVEPVDAPGDASAHADPEPALLAKRTLAMWLARIALPATYGVIYSLAAMMPLLPVMRPLATSQRTLVGSVWMAARWLAFLWLGLTAWWHTRPKALLVAAVIMLVAFVGVAVRPAELLATPAADAVGLAA